MKNLPERLEPRVRDGLEGRAACWHQHLGGEMSLDQCLMGAIEFMGGASVEELCEDYEHHSPVQRGDFDPERLPARWMTWLKDQEPKQEQATRVLLALAAFAQSQGASDFQVVIPDLKIDSPHLNWVVNGEVHVEDISLAAAEALCVVGIGSGKPVGNDGFERTKKGMSPLGELRIVALALNEKRTLNVRPRNDTPEKAGDTPLHLAKSQPFMDAMVARARAVKAQGEIPDPRMTMRRRMRT